jgi:hypothetical protein
MKETAVVADFAGKTALITGAGRGIGRAVALGLADAGASLILLARSTAQLAETRAMLIAQGATAERIRILPADLGDEEQRTRAAEAVLAPGRVDILVVMSKKTEEVPVYFPGTTGPCDQRASIVGPVLPDGRRSGGSALDLLQLAPGDAESPKQVSKGMA